MARPAAAPDLFERPAFEAFVRALPATVLVRQWGDASVGKVGGKIFAILGLGPAAGQASLSFKCSDLSFQLLPELTGVRPAPYLARAGWVAVGRGSALRPAELAAYVAEAHRLVAARLPRRVRTELGLELLAARPMN
jgi:predicted DNA-binding protein (MmcQ/YjbR family)